MQLFKLASGQKEDRRPFHSRERNWLLNEDKIVINAKLIKIFKVHYKFKNEKKASNFHLTKALAIIPLVFFVLLHLCNHEFFKEDIITCAHQSHLKDIFWKIL